MDSNVSGFGNSLTALAVRYHNIYAAGGAWGSAVTADQVPMSNSGTVSSLYAETVNAPGVGITRTWTVYKNGVATALTCTTADNGTTASDTSNSVSYVAGDTLAMATSASTTTAATGVIAWSLKLTAAANVSQVGVNSSVNVANGATSYMGLMGFGAYDATAATNVENLVPTEGTFKNIYVQISGSPGGVGKSYAFTLYKNGSPTSLAATCADTSTTANDTTDTVTVAAGDTVYIEIVPTGTPTLRQAMIGIEFDPDTNGESIQMRTELTALNSSGVRFMGVQGNFAANSVESNIQALIQTCVIRKFYGKLSTAPTAGKSRQFQVSVEASAGNPSFTISDSATTGNDTSNSVSATAGNTVTIKTTPSGTPVAAFASTGLVTFITPPVTFTPKVIFM